MEIARARLLLVISLLGARAASAGVSWDDLGGSAALTSDDVFHGISQTCGDPAAQADLHYRSSGGHSPSEGFLGVWASEGLGASHCGKARELNVYGGYSLALGQDTSASLTYTHYGYPGGAYTLGRLAGHRYDYDALEGQWSWADQVSLTVAWTPNALRYANGSVLRDRNALSYGLQLREPLMAGISASAGLGYDKIMDPFGTGYGFWNLGLDYALGPVQLQAGYFWTSGRAERLFGDYVGGNRASASLIWRF